MACLQCSQLTPGTENTVVVMRHGYHTAESG